MTVAAIVAVVAAVAAAGAAALTFNALTRARERTRTLEQEIERGKATFELVIAREAEERAAELEQALSLARARALSALAEDERRIAEERRRDVAERERDAGAKLSAALTEAQRSVEQRFVGWSTDLTQLQGSLATERERIAQRQRQLRDELDAKIAAEAERLQTALDEHRALVVKLREELDRTAEGVAAAAAADLESHAADRRRALNELADRLRKRERELGEQIDREQTELSQRIAAQLENVERRQIEQVRRIVSREAQRSAEEAGQGFETTIRNAREDAARRLGRELDLAVERFAREGESMLAERIESELRHAEARLHEIARRLDELTARA